MNPRPRTLTEYAFREYSIDTRQAGRMDRSSDGQAASSEQVTEFLKLPTRSPRGLRFRSEIPSDLSPMISSMPSSPRPTRCCRLRATRGACRRHRAVVSRIFGRLDHIDGALDRVEKGIVSSREKHDAALLARFRAALRELRDGIRALVRTIGSNCSRRPAQSSRSWLSYHRAWEHADLSSATWPPAACY